MSYLREMSEQGYNSENIDDFHRHMIPWMLSSNGISKEGVIVDIGAGQGHCLIPLQESGWKNLIAVDIDDYNFPMFRRDYGFASLLCDIGTQILDLKSDSINAVICFHVIEHLTKPDNLLSESYRVLANGGKLFLVTPDWRKQYKTFWRDPTHLRPFDKEAMARLLRMYKFKPSIYSWNARYGMGRLHAYRWLKYLGMIGTEILAIGEKE